MRLRNEDIVKMQYEKANNKQDIRWDSRLRGFGIRIYPTGSKTYVVAYRIHGKRKIKTFGRFEEMDVEAARQKAKELLNEVKSTNRPICFPNEITVGKLCEIYIERRAMRMRSHKDEIRRIRRHILARWEKSTVYSVTVRDLQMAHDEVTKRGPVEANRVIQTYRRIINRGKEWYLIPKEFPNPAEEITQHPERKRDRYVNIDELPRLLKAINDVNDPYVRAALWLYLLTGTRKMELLKAKRRDLDIHQKTLRLLETKNGQDRYIHLSDLAVEILINIPEKPGNPYLFCGRNPGRPLVNIYGTWERVREDAGMPDLTIHDLRRSVGSYLAQSGHSLILIGEVLGHKDLSSTEIYARFGNSHVKDALSDLADDLVDKTSIKPRLKWIFNLEDINLSIGRIS